MKANKKSGKINYFYNALIIIIAIILFFFMIDGRKIYTISNNYLREFSEEKIIETIPSTENIEFLAETHENLSSVFVYKTDDTYAILIFNNSIFLNRSRLSSYIYKIPEIDGFKINESNQVYNNSFSIEKNDEVVINNNSIQNNNLIINIVNFVIVLLIAIIGTIYNIKKKTDKVEEE